LVQNLIVEKPEEYLFSSVRNNADMDSLTEVVLESSQQITYG